MIPSWALRLAGYDSRRTRGLAEASRTAEARTLTRAELADSARFEARMNDIGRERYVRVGTTASGVPYDIGLTDLASLPSWVTAATGAGKSRLVGSLMAQVIAHIVQGAPVSLVVLDGKDETADSTLRYVASVAQRLPGTTRSAFLAPVNAFRFFDSDWLPSWPILTREDGIPIEVQADAIADVLSEVVMDASVGSRQRPILSAFEALSIEKGILPVEQPWLLSSAARVEELAAQSALPSVRLELSRFSRESASSVDGLVARINTMLRLPSLKAVFTGTQPMNFRACFDPGHVSVFSFGGAPAGARAAIRAVGSLVISSLVNAAFDPRRTVRGITLIVIDEPQTALTTVSLAQLERLLTLGRSYGAGGLMLLHQGATQLPQEFQALMNTNVALRVLGRSAAADANAASEWLPSTGTVPRRRPPAGRPHGGDRYLSEGEERHFRVSELGRLPVRHFLVADRRLGAQPRIVQAAEYNPPAWADIDPTVAAAVRRGRAGVSRLELEARVREIESMAAERFEAERRAEPQPRRRRGAPKTPDIVGSGRPGKRGEVP